MQKFKIAGLLLTSLMFSFATKANFLLSVINNNLSDRYEVVQILIDSGKVDVNSKSESCAYIPLNLAIANYDVKMVELLLKNGARTDIEQAFVCKVFKNSIEWAKHRLEEAVKYLPECDKRANYTRDPGIDSRDQRKKIQRLEQIITILENHAKAQAAKVLLASQVENEESPVCQDEQQQETATEECPIDTTEETTSEIEPTDCPVDCPVEGESTTNDSEVPAE